MKGREVIETRAPAHAPAHERRRINVQAIDLHQGDVIRDYGIDRTVLRVVSRESILFTDLVEVMFEPEPDYPALPDHLAIKAWQSVTTWRTEA